MGEMTNIAKELNEQRKLVEEELKELKKRYDLASRRLAAYETEQAGGTRVWLGTPSEITIIKNRLEAACKDDKVLMELVEELRNKRETLTNEVFTFYAQKAGN